MARVLLILSCVLSFNYLVKSQIIRSPLSLLNRPYTESIIEAPRNYFELPIEASRNYFELPIEASRNYINLPRVIEANRNYLQPQQIIEPPCNGIVPVSNIPVLPNIAPSSTVITDCTPSVCKNLADTINLMVVSNLLQNSKVGDQALQLAAPFLKEIISNSGLVGNYQKLIPNSLNPNLIASNVVAPNFFPQNTIGPNWAGSNFYAPSPVAPRMVAPTSNVIPPNAPNSALLSSLLKLLGGAV